MLAISATTESKSSVLMKVPDPRLLTTTPCNSRERDGFPDGASAYLELLGQHSLGGQLSTMLKHPLANEPVQLPDNILVESLRRTLELRLALADSGQTN